MTVDADNLPYARLPLLIGFTGKRRFTDDPAQDKELMARFFERWVRILRRLDDELPLTPKVLMCGGDGGTDLIAVRATLERADGSSSGLWSVVLVSAYPESAPDSHEVAAQYAALEARHAGRLRRVGLRHLIAKEFEDRLLDTTVGLERQPMGADGEAVRKKFRQGQFDQLAFWLARYSSLLFAASLPATAEIAGGAKHGSVSRVVAFRRTALPDSDAEDMISRSEELLTGSKLDEPDAGHVFWIDVAEPLADGSGPPALVLEPITSLYDHHGSIRPGRETPHVPLSAQRRAVYQTPFAPLPNGARANVETKPLANALHVAKRFELFHRRQLGRWRRFGLFATENLPGRFGVRLSRLCAERIRQSRPEFAAFAPFGGGGERDIPYRFLEGLRNRQGGFDPPLDLQQSYLARLVQLTLRALIVLFLVAIFCLEGFTELFKGPRWLAGYIAIILIIAILARTVAALGWDKQAEDLRGLKEVLRVQIAWWKAGIDRMVDRVHLRSIDTDLKTIREIGATVTMWASLRAGLKISDAPLVELRKALDREVADLDAISRAVAGTAALVAGLRKAKEDWIVSQTNYHYDSWKRQRGFVLLAEQIGQIGVVTALVVLSAALEYWPPRPFDAFNDRLTKNPAALELFLAAWCALAIAATTALHYQFQDRRSLWTGPVRTPLCSAAIALAVVSIVALLAQPFLPEAMTPEPIRPLARSVEALFVAASLALVWAVNMDWNVKKWSVPEIKLPLRILIVLAMAGSLLGFIALVAPETAALSPTSDDPAHPIGDAARALVVTSTTLLLAMSGMLHYYVERRNHQAQTAEYNDCNRGFLRVNDLIGDQLAKIETAVEDFASFVSSGAAARDLGVVKTKGDDIFRRTIEVRRLFADLGELALDENESWLQAHRERPVKPIAGG